MKKFVFIAAVLLSLCGCAAQTPVTAQSTSPPAQLQQIAADDLAAAIKLATADNDQVALKCWTTVQANLSKFNITSPQVVGVASAIELKRSVRGKVNAGVPQFLLDGCSELYVQEHDQALRDMLLYFGLR